LFSPDNEIGDRMTAAIRMGIEPSALSNERQCGSARPAAPAAGDLSADCLHLSNLAVFRPGSEGGTASRLLARLGILIVRKVPALQQDAAIESPATQ
jgi:hypothetical protein